MDLKIQESTVLACGVSPVFISNLLQVGERLTLPQITYKPIVEYQKEAPKATSVSFFSFLFFLVKVKYLIKKSNTMILGFDVSKHEIVGVLIDRRASIKQTYIIRNEKEDIERLLDEVWTKYPKAIAGSEATGEYHNLLALSCLKKGLPFYVLNLIITKQFTKATVRKKKTDLTDAHVIAKCMLQGQGELVVKACFNSIKPVLRTASNLSRLAVTVGHMANRFKSHFKDEIIVQKELTKLKSVIEQSMKTIRQHGIRQTDNTLQELLCSIPGIGETLAATIIAELGDINRFKNTKSIVAFSGLDPKVRQSGYTLKRNTRLTKRGSPYLRRALYVAASISQRHDPELKLYYEKKRNEGKRYKEATVANARHILNRIYAVWKRRTPYVSHLPQKVLTQDYRSRTCLMAV